ncbi:hypothetical protein NBRC116583_00360 [Arenicella sp. 4NH20-0111]
MIKFMFKSFFAIVVVVLFVGFYGIYSASALPDWFDESKANRDFANDAVNEQLNQGGVDLLAQKSLDILRGQVSFTEKEFNAMFLASLKADADGRKLLAVSDGIKVFLNEGEVAVTAVINLDKLAKVEPKAREAVEKFDRLFWVIEGNRIAVTVFGKPVVHNGGLAVDNMFHAKIGEISFSNDTLRQLKVPVEKAQNTYLDLQYLSLKEVTVKSNQIAFVVRPRF